MRESALKADYGRTSLCRSGDWNLRQPSDAQAVELPPRPILQSIFLRPHGPLLGREVSGAKVWFPEAAGQTDTQLLMLSLLHSK